MKKKTKLFYLLTTMLCLSWMVNAQVTIGIGEAPIAGALLDLKDNADGSATKGIAMPRVSLTNLSNLYPMLTGGETDYATLKTTHVGLLVYNTKTQETSDRICPGLHVWTGDKWEPIKPYPVWPTQSEILKSDKLSSFTFLDPNSPTGWPADKDRSQYALGSQGTFTDNRAGDTPQTYNYTRFYVGIATRTKTYEVRESYSCGSDPVYGSTVIKVETGDYFEDGVWMNDNLRAEIVDPTRDNPDDAAISLVPNDYNTGNSYSLAAWGYPNKASANKNTLGLIYTWAAATNGKGGATGTEGTVSEAGLAEGLQRQGICPSGWHLPSDREWTNLENAIIVNTSLFSSTPNIGGTALDYASTGWRGVSHGAAMKSTTSANGSTASGGQSNTPALGGFNGLLSGYAYGGSVYGFGTNGYWWSSSVFAGTTAWYRSLYYSVATVGRNATYRYYLFSVRCKKN